MRPIVALALILSLSSCGGTNVLELEPGDCFNGLGDGAEVTSVATVDCSEPHDYEVFALAEHPDDGAFPGDDAVFEYGAEKCLESFDRFVGIAYEDSELDATVLYPSPESWADGDRTIQCLIYPLDESKVTGSLGSSFR